jgi:hypothetical protein
MTTLSDVEVLEYRIIDVRSRPSCTPADTAVLDRMLEKVRGLKREYLSRHAEVLRKGAAKLHTTPLDRDAPNAKNPDSMLSSASGPLAFRAPPELAGLVLHTVAGAIAVPDHGVIEVAAHHLELHSELRGRGFRQLHSIDRYGKSATGDLVQMFERSRLQPIGGDLLKSLR